MIALGVEPHAALFTFQDRSRQPLPDKDPLAGLGAANLRYQFEPLATFALHIEGFRLALAGGPGLSTAPGAPEARALLVASYAGHTEPSAVEEEAGPRDKDLDGIPDEYDACPAEAGPKARRGCPYRDDVDGDGIVEGDACPEQPGLRYDDATANGCPDRDNDHFADPVDPCPIEPGPTTGGCPKYARLTKKGEFDVRPPIRFARGSAELSEKENEALREVILTLLANPKIQQVSVAVGTRNAAQSLTDQRAKAVLDVFTEQNVDTNRYEVTLSDALPEGRVTVRVVR